MLFFLVSVVVSLASSVFIEIELGAASYFPIALVTVIALFALFLTNERIRERRQKLALDRTLSEVAVDYVTLIGLAVYLGLTWPSLPLIIWLGRRSDGARTSSPPTVSSDPRSRSEPE